MEKNNELDVLFWSHRWQTGQTGWDIGEPSPPLTNYLQQYSDKEAAVFIPGCGNAYEAEWMAANGFTNITLLDIAPESVARLKEKFKSFPQIKILFGDFFQHRGSYDLIIEQTFFCAQIPERRTEYVKNMYGLLADKGKLAGLFFSKEFEAPGPPFGGSKELYKNLFEPYFTIKIMEPCYNSIKPRAGNELFFVLQKK